MRLRMKVWTDPDTGKRFLMPAAFLVREFKLLRGRPIMKAYAMNDEETKVIVMTDLDWDALPFFYFKEDGECTIEERPKRPPDLI